MRLVNILGTGGQGDTKLICGIRTAGMNHRARKADKVKSFNQLCLLKEYEISLKFYWSAHICCFVGFDGEIQLKMQFI